MENQFWFWNWGSLRGFFLESGVSQRRKDAKKQRSKGLVVITVERALRNNVFYILRIIWQILKF